MEKEEENDGSELQCHDLSEIYENLAKMNQRQLSEFNQQFYENLKIRTVVFLRTLEVDDKGIADEMKENYFKTKYKMKEVLKTKTKKQLDELNEEWERFKNYDNPSEIKSDQCVKVINVSDNFNTVNTSSIKEVKDTPIYFLVSSQSRDVMKNHKKLPLITHYKELSFFCNPYQILLNKNNIRIITDDECLINLASHNFCPMRFKKDKDNYSLEIINENDQEFWNTKREECLFLLQDHLKTTDDKWKIPFEVESERTTLIQLLSDLKSENFIDELTDEKVRQWKEKIDEHARKIANVQEKYFEQFQDFYDLFNLISNYAIRLKRVQFCINQHCFQDHLRIYQVSTHDIILKNKYLSVELCFTTEIQSFTNSSFTGLQEVKEVPDFFDFKDLEDTSALVKTFFTSENEKNVKELPDVDIKCYKPVGCSEKAMKYDDQMFLKFKLAKIDLIKHYAPSGRFSAVEIDKYMAKLDIKEVNGALNNLDNKIKRIIEAFINCEDDDTSLIIYERISSKSELFIYAEY